jgi:hypothetical protein
MSRRGANKKTMTMTPIIELKKQSSRLKHYITFFLNILLVDCYVGKLLDTIIWYVFEGAQRQISLSLFSIIIQTIQELFDHFHEKLHEVSSSSKLKSCLRAQKLGAQPWTQYFQGSSRQQLEICLVYSIFYAFHTGTSLGKSG